MKPLLTLFLACLLLSANAQTDLLLLKKGSRTEQTWITGSYIHFQFSSKQWIQGFLKQIRNDSILVDQVAFYQVPTVSGFPRTDTAHMGFLKLHVHEIYALPKRNRGVGIFTNGLVLKMGSSAYLFLNVFNSLIHNEAVFSAVNLNRMAVAGGVYLAGTLLGWAQQPTIVLGRKYSMQTIHLQQGQ